MKTTSKQISAQTLAAWLDAELNAQSFKDYCPNGLQVEGKKHIRRVISAVTASQRAIDLAIERKADALLVHHGLFWRNDEQPVVGMLKNRLSALLRADINLFAFHLPLDAHPTLGNNAQLGKVLGLAGTDLPRTASADPLVMACQLDKPLTLNELSSRIKRKLKRAPLVVTAPSQTLDILRVAWCTGGAQGYIESAAALGAQLFISGEISEQTTHLARELGVHYIAAGHHATERYGVQALGASIAAQFGIEHEFIDDDNPA